jgi:hypothetical protein
VHGHSSWSTFGLHLVKGPWTMKTNILVTRTMEVVPWNGPTQNRPLTWDDFMVHSVNRPLMSAPKMWPWSCQGNALCSQLLPHHSRLPLTLRSLILLLSELPLLVLPCPPSGRNSCSSPPDWRPEGCQASVVVVSRTIRWVCVCMGAFSLHRYA